MTRKNNHLLTVRRFSADEVQESRGPVERDLGTRSPKISGKIEVGEIVYFWRPDGM